MILVNLELFHNMNQIGPLGFELENLKKVHSSVSILLCDMGMQSRSFPLDLGGKGLKLTSAKGHLGGIFQSTFPQKLLGLVALVSNILTLLRLRNIIGKTNAQNVYHI